MISLSPNVSPSDTTGLFNLIALISDPSAAKARLDELVQAKVDVDIVQASTAQLASQAAADRQVSDAALTEAARIKNDLEQTLNVRAVQLEEMSTQLGLRQAALDDTEKRLVSLTESFNSSSSSRSTELDARDASLAARESEVTQREAAAKLLKDTYDAKVEALQAALTSQPKSYTLAAETGQIGVTGGSV